MGASTTCFRDRGPHRLCLSFSSTPSLPQGEKPGSWARGKLGGSVCDQGNGYSSGKWLSSLPSFPLSLVPPWTPTLTRLLFSSFIMWLSSSSPFVLLAAFKKKRLNEISIDILYPHQPAALFFLLHWLSYPA